MRENPGVAGWFAVGLVVAVADGYALATRRPTMSDQFFERSGVGVFLLAGTAAHLLTHRRL